MKKQKIGEAIIQYSQNGNPISARFEADMSIKFDADIIKQLLKVDGADDQIKIKQNADMALAGFFQEITNVEIADRAVSKITSAIVECVKYKSKQVRVCRIAYYVETEEISSSLLN